MGKRGSVIRLMDPEESGKFIQNQFSVFSKLVDDLGMKIQ
jgi:hypothetical protein